MCIQQFSVKALSLSTFFVSLSLWGYEASGNQPIHFGTESSTIYYQGSNSHATREDIRHLQHQLNEKSTQIDSIYQRLYALETQSANLSRQHDVINYKLEDLVHKYNATSNSIAALRFADAEMSASLSSVDARVNSLGMNVTQLASVDSQLRLSIDGLTGTMSRMNASIRHLHDVNQIWKTNFRAINATFRNLRKKVTFQLPAFSV